MSPQNLSVANVLNAYMYMYIYIKKTNAYKFFNAQYQNFGVVILSITEYKHNLSCLHGC